MKPTWPVILLSLLAHVLLLACLIVLGQPPRLPDPPKIMQAVLMTPSKVKASNADATAAPAPAPEPVPVPKPAPEPKPEPKPLPAPKPEPKPEPKPAPVTKPLPQPQPKPAPAKPEPAKPRKPVIDEFSVETEMADAEAASRKAAADAAKRKREAEERAKADAIAAQAEADAVQMAADAQRARQMAAQIGEFQMAIHKKIKGQWRRPSTATGKLVTLMRITVLPGGEVASVVITQPSGNEAFDASALEAVRRASPLPVPSDPVLFREQFKVLMLKFKPEE